MHQLSDYGKFARYYKGRGKLITESDDQETIEYEFEAAQFVDGDMRLILLRDGDLRGMGTIKNHIHFEGNTHDGRLFRAVGPIIVNDHSVHTSNIPGENRIYHQMVLHLTANARLQIGDMQELDSGEVRFTITNFEYIGTEVLQVTPTHTKLSRLRLNIDETEVIIDQVPDYDERLQALKVTRGYDITSELIIPLNQCTLEKAIEIASRICDLLAIARGRRVNWIFYEVHDGADEIVYAEHRGRITTRFTGFELIDSMPPENTKAFIEQCYTHCSHPDFSFDVNTIANLNANIRTVGYIESRCLLIFSLLDHCFHVTPIKHLTRQGEFMTHEEKNKVGVNKRIKPLVEAYSVPIEDDEITFFNELRNNLVHELKYLSDRGDSNKQYLELLHFYDRIILRILGYTGYYLNWTREGLWQGQQADKLTPKKHV